MTQQQTALDQAIAAAGGVARLAARIGVHHSQIVRWRRSGRIPADRLVGLEEATGIPRQDLRPDLFPRQDPKGLAETEAPLAAEARALGLDPGLIAARAVQEAISAEKARRWQEENREAIEAHHRWVEQNGLPLAKYRMF